MNIYVIATFTYTKNFLRAAAGIFLIMLMACKVMLPVFIGYSSIVKPAVVASDDSEDEKKSENDAPSKKGKEKDFANFFSSNMVQTRSYVAIEHTTSYLNNYKTIYSLAVFGPPPDACLQLPA